MIEFIQLIDLIEYQTTRKTIGSFLDYYPNKVSNDENFRVIDQKAATDD